MGPPQSAPSLPKPSGLVEKEKWPESGGGSMEVRWRHGMIVLPLALLVTAGPPAAVEAGETPPDCWYSDTHNTAKLTATPRAIVEGGANLNGTAGTVVFDDLETATQYLLRGPNGTEAGPTYSLGDQVLFPRVPLCHTGAWELVEVDRNDANETVSTFRTAETPGNRSPSTITIDAPALTNATASYHAGSIVNGSSGYEGDFIVSRPGAGEAQRTRVFLDWTMNISDVANEDTVYATVLSTGEDGTRITTRELPQEGTGTVSAYPTWSNPSFQRNVHVSAWTYDDGAPVFYSPEDQPVLVRPENPASTPP